MLLALTITGAALAEESPPDGFLEYLGAMVESGDALFDPLAMAPDVAPVAVGRAGTMASGAAPPVADPAPAGRPGPGDGWVDGLEAGEGSGPGGENVP